MTIEGKKIIKDNPDASPHELLTRHGLSESDYNEYVANYEPEKAFEASKANGKKANDAPKEPPVQHPTPPVVPEKAKATQQQRSNVVQSATPKTSPIQPIDDGRVLLKDKSNNTTTAMSRVQAIKWQRRFPTQYEIV